MGNPYDASSSLLGYLFQCRWALLEALRHLVEDGSFVLSLETIDDVAFEQAGKPADILQTKHHVSRQGNLTDSSEDLWKSIRAWIDGRRFGRIPADALLSLVTTEMAAPGTVALYLRADGRNVLAARERLDQVARTSESQSNRQAYADYLSLGEAERLSFVGRITVFDRAPAIADVTLLLEQSLAFAVSREKVASLVTRLEGWWFQRVIGHLSDASPDRVIRSEEIDAELDRLRGQFAEDNLPIDADLLEIEIDSNAFSSHMFVGQLKMIDLLWKRIIIAMRQYFRAKEQRSRWLREGFLLVGDLDTYDRRLCEEWDTRFQAMIQELGPEVAEQEMRKAAHQLYRWAEIEVATVIRPACVETFVPRGSLQMLADVGRVGWHPQFLDRIKHLAEDPK